MLLYWWLYCRLFLLILAGIGAGCDFWVLDAESAVGVRGLKVVLREQSMIYIFRTGWEG
jgi:hypothetical protein